MGIDFKQNGSWSYQFNLDGEASIYLRTVKKRSGTLHNLVRLRVGSQYGSPRHKIIQAEVWAGIMAIIQMEPDAMGVLLLIEQDMVIWNPSKARSQFEALLPVMKSIYEKDGSYE